MSAINVGEVFYFLRKNGAFEVSQWWRELSRTMPITISTPSLDDIWDAEALKASYRIAYADAIAAGLAQKHGCPLLTGDPELRAVANLELDWIGRAQIK
jgi:predicted nucleic acid-binding protein